MKIKGIDRTANVAWSPQTQHPIYLAAGTADQPFGTTAALEVYELNLEDPGHDMTLVASAQRERRFHKLKWGCCGQTSAGTLVGGCDGGVIETYDVGKFLGGEFGSTSEHGKHNGPVKALDFNTFKSNLLASGASESEIYIWDLNSPATPMTPGSKSQPAEDVTSVAWNLQVQHILASSFPSKCVVWDLRKNDPIIKLSDSTVRIRWSVVAWNPDVATQLCLGSEADQNPVIQLWDLRFATSPLKILDNHRQGVLSLSWCQQDADMLLSCGRDNKICCWNPNSSLPGAEVICEITSSDQWNFDVSWCSKNPALFACSSFDGHVSVYSLVGGPQQIQTSNKIADSFPGMELYTQAPLPQSHSIPVELKKAPKWLKRPTRASFSFGGKLVSIENIGTAGNESPPSRMVYISQVITEPELVSRSTDLQLALRNGQYAEFCRSKAEKQESDSDGILWKFLAANFDASPRMQYLSLLGYRAEEVNGKLAEAIGRNSSANDHVRKLGDGISALGRSSGDGIDLNERSRESEISRSEKLPENFKISVGDDTEGLVCQALLLGNTEAAVELCLQNDRMADAIILAVTEGPELLARTRMRYFEKKSGYLSNIISAVVTEDWSRVIRNCDIDSWKEALAAAVSHAGEKEFPVLCEILGERLETEKNGLLQKNAQLCYVCAGNVGKLVSSLLKSDACSSPENLQELVELFTILKKSMELQGVQVDVSGRLADLLTKYASILAAQGSFEVAVSYLETSSDPQIVELRERLNHSLGRIHPCQGHQMANSKQSKPRSTNHPIGAMSSGGYQSQKLREEAQMSAPVVQPAFNLNPLQGNQTAIHGIHSYRNQATTSFAPSLPSSVPPQSVPPPLAGTYPSPSPGPVSGLTARSKHVLDPSVQSSGPRPLSATQYYPQNQFQSFPYPQTPHSNSNFSLNPSGYPPDVFGPDSNSNQTGSACSVLPPASQMPPRPSSTVPAPGWNDPPAIDSSRTTMLRCASYYHHPKEEYRKMSAEHAGTRKWKSVMSHAHSLQQPKQEFAQPAPITHPLMGGSSATEQAMNGQAGDPYQNPQAQAYQYQAFQSQQLQQQQLGNVRQQYENANYQIQNQSMGVRQTERETAKKAIPEEHAILGNVFEELRRKCLTVANNPQFKKKLDDVSRKLEALYDNLREGKLSSNTLQGLHLMVQHVQAGNYPNGLMLHTQLVSGPDFSQIASFMPGIKVLLQSALQLEVYL